jgi:hypothetical protein
MQAATTFVFEENMACNIIAHNTILSHHAHYYISTFSPGTETLVQKPK